MACERKGLGLNYFYAPGSSFLQCITAREGCCPIVWMLLLVGPKGSFPQQEEGCGANVAWKETASLGTCNFL